ncbi:MAG: PqqD family protein [Candidatus Promineifilaceae bacterium]
MAEPLRRVPALTAGLIWQAVEDGTVVVSPAEGVYRTFNPSGSHVWALIDGKNDVLAIAAAFQKAYHLEWEQAVQHVNDFLAALEERGLLNWQPGE